MAFGRMGVRGVAHEDVSCDLVFRYARVAGSYWDVDRVAVGRDTRTTSEMFDHVATGGLTRAGCAVDRLGTVPTPAIQRYVETNPVAGIQITASHNPPDHNGLKLIGSDGSVLDPDEIQTIHSLVDREDSRTTPSAEAGSARRIERTNDAYVESILDAVDCTTIQNADLSVVVDTGNGAGGLTAPSLFRQLGCQVRSLNAQPDGSFPGRNPEPVKAELEDLMQAVETSAADLGIAHDGDADRVVFVDETGAYVDGNTALAALAHAVIESGDRIVTTCNASQRLTETVEAADATVDYVPIGNSHVLSRVRELQQQGYSVPIAGEGNGGIIYPAYRLGRDGGYVAARFLQLITDRSASEVLDPHRGYCFERENISYSDDAERDRILDRAAEWAADSDGTVTSLDGYRVDFDDGWVLVRPSGTEPYVRIYAEARSVDRATELAASVRQQLS